MAASTYREKEKQIAIVVIITRVLDYTMYYITPCKHNEAAPNSASGSEILVYEVESYNILMLLNHGNILMLLDHDIGSKIIDNKLS